MTEGPASLFRQRLPFLGLLGAAILGILAGRCLPFPAAVWLGIAALAATAFFWKRPAGFFLLCASAFAIVQIWQGRDSAGARLADWLESNPGQATVTGLVAGEPRVFDSGCSFDLQVEHLATGECEASPRVTILADWPGKAPAYGDRVRITGSLANLEPPRNPGQFNFAAWSALRQVYSRISTKDQSAVAILAHNQGNPVVTASLRARQWMHDTLVRGINDPVISDLIVAMILGDTSSMPEDIQEQFRGTGTYHLFSVSGLHVGMLAFLLWSLLRIFPLSRRQASLIILPALFFYVFMTGWKPPSVRSAVMASVVICGLIANRQPILFNNLCAAAFLILLGDTNQLFNAGFQFSFCVVAALVVFTAPLTRLLERPILPDPFLPEKLLSPLHRAAIRSGRHFAGLCAVALAAWCGSLPLSLGYFHLVSFSSLPANLLAVPTSFLIMAVSMLSLLSGGWIWLSEIFNQTNWLLTRALLWTTSLCASLPGSYVYLGAPQVPQPVAEIVVFDFGAGGANWISVDGQGWLLDCGPAFRHDSTLVPFLRQQGRRSIDGLLLTHGDANHIGAASELLKSCPPRIVVDSAVKDRSSTRRKFQEALSTRHIPKSLQRSGDVIELSPRARLTVLHPPPQHKADAADDKVLVVRLEVDGVRVLFLSDASPAVETLLLQLPPGELRSDILVKGRPRSEATASPEFLAAVDPKVVIASAADRPSSEILPASFVNRLAASGITLFRQDHTGAATIRISSTRWEVSAFLGSQKYFQPR